MLSKNSHIFGSNLKSPKKRTNRQTRGTWTLSEDEALAKAVELYGAKNWKKIAESVPGRSDVQCLHRWQKVLNPELVKGPWTEEEDQKVRELVKMHGAKKWSLIASHLPGRIGKQCRERWTNHLDPGVKKENWEPWEDELIIKLQREIGNKWARIAKHLEGRTDNAVKNRFNSTISRRIRQQKVTDEEEDDPPQVLESPENPPDLSDHDDPPDDPTDEDPAADEDDDDKTTTSPSSLHDYSGPTSPSDSSKVLGNFKKRSNGKPNKNWKVNDVVQWLKSLNLQRDYTDLIVSNGVDGEVLLTMNENDWKEIGITSFGDRRKCTIAMKI